VTLAPIEAAWFGDFRRRGLFSQLCYRGPGTYGKTARLNVPSRCQQAAERIAGSAWRTRRVRAFGRHLRVVASSYFTVRWGRGSPDGPVLRFGELREPRLETRKVEEFADGRRIRSDRIGAELGTSLSWEPIPSEAELDSQADVTVQQLTADEFEAVWSTAA
jgi:hypothetical protein